MVEHALLVFLQLFQKLGVAGGDLLDVRRVDVLDPRWSALAVDVVEIVEERDVLEGFVDGAFEFGQDALVNRALQLVTETVSFGVLVLIEEEDKLGG